MKCFTIYVIYYTSLCETVSQLFSKVSEVLTFSKQIITWATHIPILCALFGGRFNLLIYSFFPTYLPVLGVQTQFINLTYNLTWDTFHLITYSSPKPMIHC